MLDYVRRANSWDEVRNGLYEGYKFYLDYEMNMRPKGRPLPDMEPVLGILMENQEMLGGIFLAAFEEEWNNWAEAPANVDVKELGQRVGGAFLTQGPGAIGPVLLEMGLVEEKEMSGEEYEAMIAKWNTPVLPAMMKAITEVLSENSKFNKKEVQAVLVYF